MTRVLVCGGRDYGMVRHQGREIALAECDRLKAVLDKYHQQVGIDCIIQGGARGADMLGAQWAHALRIDVEQYDADWENQGSFAGPARNKRMLEEGQPDLVIAFPGGRGTADMVRKARKAGVEVVEISHG